jgi:hypothetical protein
MKILLADMKTLNYDKLVPKAANTIDNTNASRLRKLQK